jgi:hypothetical protein
MKKLLLTTAFVLSATSLNQVNAASEPLLIGNHGERFTVTSVPGDGDCAFTAIGKSRAEVVAALKDAVEAHDGAYRNFNSSRSALHDAVAGLTVGSSVDTVTSILNQVEAFVLESTSQYPSDPEVSTPSMLAVAALAEFRSGLGSFSAEEFVSAKRVLQSRIENMYYERYEAFQEALKQELKESGISESRLQTKAELKQSIEDVFAHNNGKASWLPMGLIFGIHERLDLNLAVWSSRGQTPGYVQLYQFSGSEAELTSPTVRHVVWNGGHFDILALQQ